MTSGTKRHALVRISEPQQLSVLRDYFCRLGATTQIEPDHALSVHFPDNLSAAAERAEIKTYLDAWTARNHISAELID